MRAIKKLHIHGLYLIRILLGGYGMELPQEKEPWQCINPREESEGFQTLSR